MIMSRHHPVTVLGPTLPTGPVFGPTLPNVTQRDINVTQRDINVTQRDINVTDRY